MKQRLSILLTILMIMTVMLPATAFAESTGKIPITHEGKGRVQIELTANTYGAPMPVNSNGSKATMWLNKNGKGTFVIPHTGVLGEFSYNVREIPGKNKKIKYDPMQYTITLYFTNTEVIHVFQDGSMDKVDEIKFKDTSPTDPVDPEDPEKKKKKKRQGHIVPTGDINRYLMILIFALLVSLVVIAITSQKRSKKGER